MTPEHARSKIPASVDGNELKEIFNLVKWSTVSPNRQTGGRVGHGAGAAIAVRVA
jgi:hypothetical protein